MDVESLFKISYGLYAVCSKFGIKSNAYIANTVFQVTAEPAKFAISCNKNNYTYGLIKDSGLFSFSILNMEAKAELIGLLGYKSGKDIDKFAEIKHIFGKSGCPIITEDTIAWFECRVVNSFDVGTHVIFVGELIENQMLHAMGEPLTYAYYRDIKKGKAPKNAPTYVKVEEFKSELSKRIYYCPACGYEYNPDLGDPDSMINPGTEFEDLPDNWECPVCGLSKSDFVLK